MKHSAKRRVHAALLGALSLSLAPPAAASASFPQQLRQGLGATELPYGPLGCQLCHQDDAGGYRTATKPFGRAVLAAGTMGGSVPSLLAALSTLDAAGTDSDNDGTGDIAELRAGTDPNLAETMNGEPPAAVEDVPLPRTGCALSRAGFAPESTAWLGALLALALISRRRSR